MTKPSSTSLQSGVLIRSKHKRTGKVYNYLFVGYEFSSGIPQYVFWCLEEQQLRLTSWAWWTQDNVWKFEHFLPQRVA